MRKILFIGFLLILPSLIIAQSETTTPTIDERLYEVFEVDFLERLQAQSPSQLQYYNFFLDNAYQIETLKAGKTSTYKEVIIDDLENVNILKIIKDQQLKRDYNNRTFYKIADTNKLLVLISEKEYAKKFNQYTGRTHE